MIGDSRWLAVLLQSLSQRDEQTAQVAGQPATLTRPPPPLVYACLAQQATDLTPTRRLLKAYLDDCFS
jgi:hypothetical protein